MNADTRASLRELAGALWAFGLLAIGYWGGWDAGRKQGRVTAQAEAVERGHAVLEPQGVDKPPLFRWKTDSQPPKE